MAHPSALFRPIKVGSAQLQHRVVLAPLTRFRNLDHVPTDLEVEYYARRTTPGGLLIAEGTYVSCTSGGCPGSPGIYNDEQIQSWKKVTEAVHAKGGVIYSQLWHAGRASDLPADEGYGVVGPSAIRISGANALANNAPYQVPRELTVPEIKAIVQDHVQAAKNAMAAGFDGVEVHCANGYLLDQFLNSSSNKRTDAYGGSIENRTRFPLQVIAAVIEAVGPERVGTRLSPWSEFQDMYDDTPYETWGYLISQLQKNHPSMAYISMVEPRDDFLRRTQNDTVNSLDPFRARWKGPFISGGGYTSNPALASKVADETGNLIAIGRAYIANPDLVKRLRNGWELNMYDRSTFYTTGPTGYTDYPVHEINA